MSRQAHRHPVTLEGEPELRRAVGGDRLVASRLRLRGLFAEVFDAHTALDRPYREPPLVREDGNASADSGNATKRRNFNAESLPSAVGAQTQG